MKMLKNRKAFTLTELIVTIAVMVVLVVTWAFYGRGHVKFAMMNEGRLFIDKIVAQEKMYFNDHGAFLDTGYVTSSDPLYINVKENKYFTKFKAWRVDSNKNLLITLNGDTTANCAMFGKYTSSDDSVAYTENIDKIQ